MSRVVFIHSKQAHRYKFSNRYLTTDYLKEIYGLFSSLLIIPPSSCTEKRRKYKLKKKKLPSFAEAEKKQLAALKKRGGLFSISSDGRLGEKRSLPLPDKNSFPGVPSQCIIQKSRLKSRDCLPKLQTENPAGSKEEDGFLQREASCRLKWMLLLLFQPAQWHCLC